MPIEVQHDDGRIRPAFPLEATTETRSVWRRVLAVLALLLPRKGQPDAAGLRADHGNAEREPQC